MNASENGNLCRGCRTQEAGDTLPGRVMKLVHALTEALRSVKRPTALAAAKPLNKHSFSANPYAAD